MGNKLDLAPDAETRSLLDSAVPPPSSFASTSSAFAGSSYEGGSMRSTTTLGLGSQLRATTAPEGREVGADEAAKWASRVDIPVAVEVSALSGDNVEEVFHRLARMILTKIELGEIDPDDPQSGIQYGDGGWGGASEVGSVKSGMVGEEGSRRRRKGRGAWGLGGVGEWEDVFALSGSGGGRGGRRRGGCC